MTTNPKIKVFKLSQLSHVISRAVLQNVRFNPALMGLITQEDFSKFQNVVYTEDISNKGECPTKLQYILVTSCYKISIIHNLVVLCHSEAKETS
jgi:hypothetical protein